MKKYKLNVLIRSIKLMENRKAIYLGFMCLALIAIVIGGVIRPIMNKKIINAIEFNDPSLFYSALVLMLVSTILFWVFLPLFYYFGAWASKQAMFKVRKRLNEHLIKLPVRYHDKHSSGEILSLFSNDLRCLEGIYDHHIYKTLENFCVGFTGLIMLFVIDWKLALVASFLGVLSVIIANRFNEPFSRIGEQLQESAGKTTTIFLDIVRGIRTVKFFNMGNPLNHKLKETVAKETECRVVLVKRQAGLNTILGILNGLSALGIIFIGGYMVQRGWTDWGTVITISGLQFATQDLFSDFPASLANLQAVLAGVERVLNVISEPKEEIDRDKCRICAEEEQKVLELENVSFGYQESEPVISNLSLTLKKGEIVALTGASGSGKSTLVKLIMGLYTPTEGIIIIFGDESELSLDILRKKTAYVPQTAQLFAETIYENIACGSDETGMEEVLAAAKSAGIHDFIQSLPQGYQTVLSNDGISLSGGQRQRIAIARALVKNADLLLLDEITSSLDGENESQIMKTITQISKNTAVLLISHRETTIKYATTNIAF
ncbi:MAG: ABC transporter ATP-binding protein [Halanaerobiales bacterium]|nr:ABC transporter ATP-binding protein [Halanaerobiales bacterium]